jgi:hypothetical protein
MPVLQITALKNELTSAKARWQPKENPQALLSDEQKRNLLGVVVDKAALTAAMAPARLAAAPAPAFAPAVDWRKPQRQSRHACQGPRKLRLVRIVL